MRVRPFDDLEGVVAEQHVKIAVIATPAPAAQDVADRMVAAGVSSILNFAPAVLSVPDGVDVRKVDLSTELQILAYHEQRKATADRLVGPADGVTRTRTGRRGERAAPQPRGRPTTRGGTRMSILVVGVSHSSAPVSLLERLALDHDGVVQARRRRGRQRARHRGHGRGDLQPHRGLRRRRPLPRKRRGDLPAAGRPGRRARRGARVPLLRPLRRRGRQPPVPGRLRARLDGGRRDAGASARPARRCASARRPAASVPRSTRCSSSAARRQARPTPRPTSTGPPPRW